MTAKAEGKMTVTYAEKKRRVAVEWPPGQARLFVAPTYLIFAFLMLFLLAGCEDNPQAVPGVLRVGLLPDEQPAKVMARHQPLFDYLEAETGLRFIVSVPKNYETLEAQFVDGAIDLAYFGGLSFVNAHRQSGAVPLVSRDVDRVFTSVFITRGGEEGTELKHFVGLSFSFGSERSTSGHLMPRHYLLDQFIQPENFFSRVEYSGAHDKTVDDVRSGRVALGAANAVIYRKMIEEGQIKEGQTRIVWETPPYVDYVWAVQQEVSEDVRRKLVSAFLSLDSKDGGEDEMVLSSISAERFVKASVSDFSELEKVALELDLVR